MKVRYKEYCIYLISVYNVTTAEMGSKGVERDQDAVNTEDWVSGLNQQFTKLSTFNRVREFESHILRSFQKSLNLSEEHRRKNKIYEQ